MRRPERTFYYTALTWLVAIGLLACADGGVDVSVEAREAPEPTPTQSLLETERQWEVEKIYIPKVVTDKNDGTYLVEQQPEGNVEYVGNTVDQLTQFSLATQRKNIGLIAHNNSPEGEMITNLVKGDRFFVFFLNGKTVEYKVGESYRFWAESPQSVTGDFVPIDEITRIYIAQLYPKEADGEYSAAQVFYAVFDPVNADGIVIFQTCIYKDLNNNGVVDTVDESGAGRMFVMASPVE